jgi:hypothetical protein
MKNAFVLFLRASLVFACLLAAAWPATAYIKAPPPPELGAMCQLSSHVSVLQVNEFSAEKGVILFKPLEQLKGTEKLPDATRAKLVIRPDVKGSKVILDWAAEGKKAVLFALIKVRVGHIYIDGYWYRVSFDQENNCWFAVAGEPDMLTGYCGTADKLGEAVTKILRGEDVVVPAILGEKSGRPVIRDLRASLPIPGNDPKGKGSDKKPTGRKPDLVGTVEALSGDGKSFTLLPRETNKNKEPTAVDIGIADTTTITAGSETSQLVVGQTVFVWLGEGDVKIAATVRIDKPRQ